MLSPSILVSVWLDRFSLVRTSSSVCDPRDPTRRKKEKNNLSGNKKTAAARDTTLQQTAHIKATDRQTDRQTDSLSSDLNLS